MKRKFFIPMIVVAVAVGAYTWRIEVSNGNTEQVAVRAPEAPDNTVRATPSNVPQPKLANAAQPAAPAIPPAALTATVLPKMGEAVTDAGGWILYRFDKDTAAPPKSNCAGECAKLWPPVLTSGEPKLQGIATRLVATVDRGDGTKQVTLDGWPLYRYTGDSAPGQWKGQGLGGTWFVAAPDGTKNLSCLPAGSSPAPAPSAAVNGY